MAGAEGPPGVEELAAAVEADLVAHVSALYATPLGEVHEDSGATWFLTGVPSRHHNGVLRAALEPARADEDIERLLQPFRERGLPGMWWVFHSMDGLDPVLDAALLRHGLTLESDRPGLGLRLEDLSVPDPVAGAQAHRVRTEDEFRVWTEIVAQAFEDPEFESSPSVAGFAARGFGDDGPFRHYLCRWEGRWCGAATLCLAAGVAGLANVATPPSLRGRGIGRHLAGSVLAEARALGLEIAALSSDPLGVGIYERLGFRRVCRHRTYVWMASPRQATGAGPEPARAPRTR